MQEKKNDKSKIVARVLVICAAALIVLAAAAGVILSRRYVRLGQQFIPVNAAKLDLRGAGLTDLTPLDRCTALTELDVRENKLSAEALEQARALTIVPKGHGIGLKNIHERLHIVFPSFTFQIDSTPGRGTSIRILIPKKEVSHVQVTDR